MRDMSHKAAAALTLGLINDDIFGALMNAPSGAARNAASLERDRFADYLAASRWLRKDAVVTRDDRTVRAWSRARKHD